MLGDISSYGTSLFMYSCHADIEVREETVVSLLSDESDNEGNNKKSEPSCKQGKRTPMKALKRPASNKPKQVAKQKKTGAEKEKTCSEKEKEGDKKEMREVPSNPKKNYLKNYYKKNRFCLIEKQLFSWITTVSIWQRLHKGNAVRNIGCVH